MRFREFLTEATPTPVSAEQVGKTIKNWFFKNGLTHADFERDEDHNFFGFEKWREFTFDSRVKMQVHPISIKLHLGELRWLVKPEAVSPKLDFSSDRGEWFDEGVKLIERLIRPLGWYVANAKAHLILLPLKQDIVKTPQHLYHFSPAFYKNSILRKGLLPRGTKSVYGEKFNDAFRYPPRIHLFTKYDLAEMRKLAYHIFNHDADIESFYRGSKNMVRMPLVVFEVDTGKCRPGTKFYEDYGVKNGVWTYTHIPPAALSVKFEDEVEEDDDKTPF